MVVSFLKFFHAYVIFLISGISGVVCGLGHIVVDSNQPQLDSFHASTIFFCGFGGSLHCFICTIIIGTTQSCRIERLVQLWF
jgi:hypothetical protein